MGLLYYRAVDIDNSSTRREEVPSTNENVCTHDSNFNNNLKVVDMCKKRSLDSCIDEDEKLYNKKLEGQEC